MNEAQAILQIPTTAPERLFRCAADGLAAAYRTLAMRWHPDRVEPDEVEEAEQVFKHIGALKAIAEARIESGDWFAASGQITTLSTDGRKFELKYRATEKTDFGRILIGQGIVVYLIRPEFADLADQAAARFKSFRFADDGMRLQCEPLLPKLKADYTTADYRVLVIEKDPGMIRLADLLARQGGALEPRHAAWIISRSLNLACWLDWMKWSHNDISIDSLFVNPKTHAVALLGGWWYAANQNDRLIALPSRTVNLMPSDLLTSKQASVRCDLELIRGLGRELLGDPAGVRLHANPDLPVAFREWVKQPGGNRATKDFENWADALKRAFGPRKFVELKVSFDDVYPA